MAGGISFLKCVSHGYLSGLGSLKHAEAAEITRKSSEAKLREQSADLQIIGTSMFALYQAATCHRKCYGGGHVLEGLAGRTYNLAGSAYHLITRGYYDEALNLIRGIGEISNLIRL